jgi:hypothetical protein
MPLPSTADTEDTANSSKTATNPYSARKSHIYRVCLVVCLAASLIEVGKERISSEEIESSSLLPNSSQNLERVPLCASMVFFSNSSCGIPGKV